MNGQLALLLLYSALLVALGLWIGRRVKVASDFFVAGRRLGPLLLFSTMVAANIGAGSTVGAAGIGYRDGLSAWWWVGSAAIGSLVLAFTVGPRIRDLAARHDLRTVGDFLEYRYGRAVRGGVAALLWAGTLAILAGQLIALAWVLSAVAGIPKPIGCLIGGGVMTTYFVAGGLLTSAWVNMVQLAVLLFGFALALPMAVGAAGGWGQVLSVTHSVPGYTSFWHGGSSGWHYLAMLGPSFIVSPGLLQKVYGARDGRTVRIGVTANAAVLAVFAFAPPLMGMVARALHPGLVGPATEQALPLLLTQSLPPLVGMLGLAALFSAEVSTADAILFMLSTSLSQDLYRGIVRPEATDAQVLRVARLAAVGGGAAGVAMALLLPTVIAALTIFYSLLSVSLFVPVVAGIYLRRVRGLEAGAAIATGVSTLVAVHLATDGRGVWGWTPTMLGLIVSVVACGVVLVARRERHLRRP